jgi:hypothetical protein
MVGPLPENVKANVKLFADDCLLYKEINNISVGQDLSSDLKALESSENERQMSFNADKCFIIAAGTTYSSDDGLTSVVNAFSFTVCVQLYIFLLRKPNVLFDFKTPEDIVRRVLTENSNSIVLGF